MVVELSSESVTQWLERLKAGDRAAAQKLWEKYFHQLVALARSKLRAASRRAADEEDVALSAFASFCRAAEHGRFPKLADRDDLWQLLVVITVRKAIDLTNYERRQKRRRSNEVDRRSNLPADSAHDDSILEQVLGREPTPDFAAQVAEEYARLLAMLGDQELATVAQWKMEGFTNTEIAGKIECAPRTVERKLRLIRSIWQKEFT